jgi:hypothetical protein
LRWSYDRIVSTPPAESGEQHDDPEEDLAIEAAALGPLARRL